MVLLLLIQVFNVSKNQKTCIMRTSGAVVALLFLQTTINGQITLHKVSDELIFKDAPFDQCHASTIVVRCPGSTDMIECFRFAQAFGYLTRHWG